MLVSATPGLITQITCFLITKRWKYATVHAGNFSQLGYVYSQSGSSVAMVLKGKHAWEYYAALHGVQITSCHAGNRTLKTNR